MSWLDEIDDASFRGVSFYVEKDKTRGGRRGPDHQYPCRDVPYPEDLGDRQIGFSLEAYTLGDTAFADRDALIVALRTSGPGTLVHPTMGTWRVQVRDWNVSEDLVNQRGICRFQLFFVDAGNAASPSVTSDTSAQADTAATTATASNETAFSGSFSA